MIPEAWIEQAAERIAPYVIVTPLTYDARHDIFLKWENRQVTGSFKARGAFNKVLSLHAWERQRGLVAASAGNHGQGVALAGQTSASPVIIFTSEDVVPAKLEAMKKLGAEVRLIPGGYSAAESTGLAYAIEHNATWISPYNDGQVIAGQGTTALEVLPKLPARATIHWLVPVSGGGLMAGVACAVRNLTEKLSQSPAAKHVLVGVQSEASAFMHGILKRGSQAGVGELPSLADGLAGPVEEGSVTIPILKTYLDDIILVSEEEIARSVAYAWHTYGEVIEGSAAVVLAAVLSGKYPLRPAILVISGGNIQPEIHEKLLERYPVI